MVDVQTRKLRNFVVLAEELHFSRAAERLFIAQQALSKQLQDLERDVGATLLTRSTREVALTPAGEVFLVAARKILSTFDTAVEDARRSTRMESGTLRVGFGVGAALELTAPIFDEFSERYPAVELDLREYSLSEPSAGLADGWADVALVRPPIAHDGMEFLELFVEPRCAGVSAHHRLADMTSVSVEQLLDEPIAMGRSTDGAWRRFWSLEDYRAGRPATKIRHTNSHTEELEIVAAGLGITITVAAAARYTPHQGVRYIPVDDIVGSAVAIGWATERHSTLIDHFLAVATEVRDREVEIVERIEKPFRNEGASQPVEPPLP